MGNILIRHARVVTMDEDRPFLDGAEVTVQGGVIVGVGETPAGFEAEEIVDASDHILMPGFFNAHNHSGTVLRRGARAAGLTEGLDDIWAPPDGESAYWAALLASAEMIRSGTTGFADNYFYMDRVAEAVLSSGMRAVLSWCTYGGEDGERGTDLAGITQVNWEGDHWRLAFHNSTAHLESLAAARPTTPPGGQTVPAPPQNGQPLEAVVKHYQRVAAAPVHERPRDRSIPSDKQVSKLVRLAAPRPDDRVLDAGVGFGTVALGFAPLVASVTGVDVSPAMLERAEDARAAAGVANIHLRLGEIGSIPLADGAFDIIVCHDLFQYASDLPALLRRLRRLLAPGGKLVADALVASEDPVRRATHNAMEIRRDPGITEVCSPSDLESDFAGSEFRIEKLERYSVARELDEWLVQAAADEATRGAVRSMVEAGLEADSAGLGARRSREGQILFTESRVRVLATPHDRPA